MDDRMRSTTRSDDEMRSTMAPNSAPVNSGAAPGAPDPAASQGSVTLPAQTAPMGKPGFTGPTPPPAPPSPVPQTFEQK